MWTSIAMCELPFCHLSGLLASLSGLYICRHLAICGILATFVGNVDSFCAICGLLASHGLLAINVDFLPFV